MLDVNATKAETTLQLLDLNGRVIMQQIVIGNQFTLDLNELSAGLYVLKAHNLTEEEFIKLVVN